MCVCNEINFHILGNKRNAHALIELFTSVLKKIIQTIHIFQIENTIKQ